MERILQDATRAGEVLTRIRALIKRTAPAKSRVIVNQIVRDVLVLTGGELRQKNVQLFLELPRACRRSRETTLNCSKFSKSHSERHRSDGWYCGSPRDLGKWKGCSIPYEGIMDPILAGVLA